MHVVTVLSGRLQTLSKSDLEAPGNFRIVKTGLTAIDDLLPAGRFATGALGRWLMKRFSPVVAVDAPDALLLDVTGSERLFVGMDRLIGLVSTALAKLGIAHGIAIAPNARAAWAVASFSRDQHRIVSTEQLKSVLDPLPTAALRFDDELLDILHTLGVDTVGQLTRLPRASLPARFGPALLKHIDQVFDRAADPLTPLDHQIRIHARLAFEGVVDSLETIWMAFKHLIGEILPQLIRRGWGARTLLIEFIPPDGPEVHKTISLARPTCDAATILNLLRCASESIHTRTRFVGIRLSVPLFERVSDRQLRLLDQQQQVTEAELVDLIQRLRVRLGDDSVLTPRWVESHVPERSCAFTATDGLPPRNDSAVSLPFKARPLRLFPVPAEIRCILSPSREQCGELMSFTHAGNVHSVACLSGPERIMGMWWEGLKSPSRRPTRRPRLRPWETGRVRFSRTDRAGSFSDRTWSWR